VADSPSSAVPSLPGLTFEAVEWLPSGAESGLVRIRGRWIEKGAREDELPVLALRAAGREHRFESLPDARFMRDPSSWRGTYLVAAELVASDPEALWLEWPSGTRAGLPELSRGVEPPPVAAAPAPADEPEPGGQVIDRAVLAERRARRAEDAEQAQARRAAEALKAVEVLELRSTELERRLEEATAERDALAAQTSEAPAGREALTAALASAAAVRARSRDWQLRMRTAEIARSSDAVRLAVLEAERVAGTAARDAATARATELERELGAAAEAAATARTELARERETGEARLAEAREAWERRRSELEAELGDVRARLEQARADVGEHRGRVGELESALSASESRLEIEAVARTALEDELDRERAAHAAEHTGLADLEQQASAARAERDAERAAATDLRHKLELATTELSSTRTDLEAARVEIARLGTEGDAREAEVAGLRTEGDAHEAEIARLRAEADARVAEIARLRTEGEAREAEITRLRTEGDARVAEIARLRTEGDAREAEIARLRTEGDAREAEIARLRTEAEHADASLQKRIAELERAGGAGGGSQLERLAREHAAAAAAREPAADASRIAADLDVAAESLRSRAPAPADSSAEPPVPDGEPAVEPAAESPRAEPPAPDAEPAVDWAEQAVERGGGHVTAAVESQRARVEAPPPPGPPPTAPDGGEPPAPDAEPAVEWTKTVLATDDSATPPPAAASVPAPESPVVESPAVEPPEPVVAESPTAAPVSAAPLADPAPSGAPARPAGPRIVPATRPPTRAHALGSSRREYPLLRGAIVKLAHDDPAAAGRLLAALLPAQTAVLKGPIAYDLTIRELGTFAVTIVAGRPYVQRRDRPRSRSEADFHLSGGALSLAELLAGVDHRVRRFFGPIRLRGRRRRLDALRLLTKSGLSLADTARAGAALEPGLAYRALAYAVHPSWTRGHAFTVAQAIDGEPPETWFLTARDGAGLAVAATGPEPDATVTMSRATFDRLLRGEPVRRGERPVVRGDHDAVDVLRGWTLRVQRGGTEA
jgi:hypothetical protein